MNAEFLDANWHEFDANVIYDGHGLTPYYAVYRVVQNYGGGTRVRIDIDGEPFLISLSNQESGIDDLRHESSELETIREYRINFESNGESMDDDGVDARQQRSGSFHLAPRNDGMVKEDGTPISVPDGLTGINIRAQGSNVHPDEYLKILRAAWREFGLQEDYLGDDARRDDLSNIKDLAAEVRISREVSGRFHALNAPINRISNLLSEVGEGYRKHVADDREISGYYHTATVGPMRAKELVTGHQRPKETKHYYPKHPGSFTDTNPLYYPKVCVSLQDSIDSDTVRWEDRHQLLHELHETLLNVLSWADLPVTEDELPAYDDGSTPDDDGVLSKRGPYVGDRYWAPDTTRRQIRLVEDPTPEIESKQEAIVCKALRDGMTESDWDVVEHLTSDGGRSAPKEIAEDTDWHLDTIYAALDRLDDLLNHHYGDVKLRSHKIGQQLLETINTARKAGETAASAAAKLLERDGDALERNADALTSLLDSFGIDIEDREDGQIALRMGYFDGTKDELRHALTNVMYQWRKAGLDEERLRTAELRGARVDGDRYQMLVGQVLHS